MTDLLVKATLVVAVIAFLTGLVLWVHYDSRAALLLAVLAFIFFYAGG